MHVDQYERIWIIAFAAMLSLFMAALFAGAIIFGVRAPSPGGFINPSRLENTAFADPKLLHMGGNEYEVNMRAQMWRFFPDEIRVPVGAEVTFNVTSSDVTHGFIIEHHNANLEIVPGHIATTRVTFEKEGTFMLQCHEYCGRDHHRMHATIIVGGEESTDEES